MDEIIGTMTVKYLIIIAVTLFFKQAVAQNEVYKVTQDSIQPTYVAVPDLSNLSKQESAFLCFGKVLFHLPG